MKGSKGCSVSFRQGTVNELDLI
ncbi:hypothetical protein SBDP1_530002 [Syntrophobacter sp. SbD1]|nr:hypothetical protein SBDP1_530002 [Syntrophobacter sp. SbD1]